MLSVHQLSMRFGAKILFKQVSLQFNKDCKYGIVGANGSGKSTFIKILSGELTPESGTISLAQQATLGSLNQEHYLYEEERVLDVVLKGRPKLWQALQEKKQLLEQASFSEQAYEQLLQLEQVIQVQDGYAAESEAANLLEGLGIQQIYHQGPLKLLSGGYKLRALLAQVLFGKPTILVLDEPTNHLDLYSIKWLENYLKNLSSTLLFTSHDRDFLNAVCSHIVDVDYEMIKIYKGDYDIFQKQKNLDKELKKLHLEKQEKQRAHLQEYIDRFGSKASKARQAQSKARLIDKLEAEREEIEVVPSCRLYPKFNFSPLRPSGSKVLEVKGLSKAYHHKKVLEQLSFQVERGECLAIIGPNGIGKSTLLEILMGHQVADEGIFNWGHGVRLAYFPQNHAREVTGQIHLLDWLGQFAPDSPQEKIRDLLGQLLFSKEVVCQPVHTLSGGEKARLLLAKLILQKPNVLILDEPTNHLDMEAMQELLEALAKFEGTILFVSHNRYFVSHLAKRILEISFEGVNDFLGGYEEYLQKYDKDYLNREVVLRQRDRERHQKSSVPSISYESQKKLNNQKNQLKKKIQIYEEKCEQLEQKLLILNEKLAEFYQEAPFQEPTQLIQQKEKLEIELAADLQNWEKMSLELQHNEVEK